MDLNVICEVGLFSHYTVDLSFNMAFSYKCVYVCVCVCVCVIIRPSAFLEVSGRKAHRIPGVSATIPGTINVCGEVSRDYKLLISL
jgi:hypothetical protein